MSARRRLLPKLRPLDPARQRKRDAETSRRTRLVYAPFHGLTVFVLSLLLFSVATELLDFFGVLNRTTTTALLPVATVGLFHLAPVPHLLAENPAASLFVSLGVSFACGTLIQRLRPAWSNARWWWATTALVTAVGAALHLIWRQAGADWPDWIGHVRDLA